MPQDPLAVVICVGPTCQERGSQTLYDDALAAARGSDDVFVGREVCLGHCLQGPCALLGRLPKGSFGLPPSFGLATTGAVVCTGVTVGQIATWVANPDAVSGLP